MIGKIKLVFDTITKDAEAWIKLLFLVIALNDAFDDPNRAFAIPIVFLCLLGICMRHWVVNHPLYWVAFMVLIPLLKGGYELAANHHYLEFYIVLLFFFQSLLKLPFTTIKLHFKWIFSLIMVLACFQKLILPEVRSGEAYHFMWSTGTMFEEISPWLMEDYASLVQENLDGIDRLGYREIGATTQLLSGPNFLGGFFKIYAWSIILFELLLAFIFWTRHQLFGQLMVLIFVLFVPLATWENTFLSLVSLLCMSLTQEKKSFFYPAFSGIILIYMSINL